MASESKGDDALIHVVLRKSATGKPSTDNFEVKTLPPLQASALKAGEILVRVLYLSVDPYMRGRIGDDPKKSSSGVLKPGDVIVGATVGEVLHSQSSKWKAGDVVHAYSGWRSHYILPDTDVTKVDTSLGIPLEKWTGVMGMTGLTSFYGLTYVGKAKKGETVVVSGAAGAVGSVVCQIAKIYGCRVVGFAGSAAKVEYLKNELKVDVAINYKTADLGQATTAACPNGVDVFYDNTGGPIYDSVMPLINHKARIVICGQIAHYNDPSAVGPRLNHMLLWKSATMQGFLVQDYEDKDEETLAQLAAWIKEGKLNSKEDVIKGLEKAPEAFLRLFDGANFGKQVVWVADPDKV